MMYKLPEVILKPQCIPINYQTLSDYTSKAFSLSQKVTHEDDRDPGDAFKRTAISLYLTHHLKLAGFFPHCNGDFFANQDVVTIVYLILRHLQSSSCNAYEIDEFVHSKDSANGNVSLGGAVYPTVSLSNHGCAHNTIRQVKN